MKKTILLALALPLLLASCESSSNPFKPSNSGSQGGTQTQSETGSQGGNQSGQETEGSGTGTTTGGGSTSGGGSTQTTTESVLKDVAEFGLSNKNEPTSINFNEDITLGFSVGNNKYKNAPTFYSSDSSLRLYFGNTLKVTNSTGVITRIVFYYNYEEDDNLLLADVGSMSDYQTWVGSASSITFKVDGDSGNIKLFRLRIDYSTSGGTTTGGGTSTGGGGTEQSGNGNTSSEWTTAWTGVQYDIAYSLFKGNLPCLKAFTGYGVGCLDGSTIMYFNPFIKGWSKEAQTHYDGALRDMGYKKIDTYKEDDGIEWTYYSKGTYEVKTSHYLGKDNDYYFDVYAYNDYQAPFKLDYTPTVELTTKVYPVKKGYKTFSKTINGIDFNCSWCTEDNSCIQLGKNSTMEITSSTALSKMDILFLYDFATCLVYAGSSSSNAKIVYNNGTHWDFPSDTKYVKILALQEDVVKIDCLSIK